MEEEKNLYKCDRYSVRSLVKVKSVTRVDVNTVPDWDWRLEFVGMTGLLSIITYLEGRLKGSSFAVFIGTKKLTTSPGALLIEDNTITLTTGHTVYEFEVTDIPLAFLASMGDMTGEEE